MIGDDDRDLSSSDDDSPEANNEVPESCFKLGLRMAGISLLVLAAVIALSSLAVTKKKPMFIAAAATGLVGLLSLIISYAPELPEEDVALDGVDLERGVRKSQISWESIPTGSTTATSTSLDGLIASYIETFNVFIPSEDEDSQDAGDEDASCEEVVPIEVRPLSDAREEIARKSKRGIAFEDRSFARMPQFEFFWDQVGQLAKEIHAGTVDPKALHKPAMFIAKKWKRHKRIFKRDTPEKFWEKNVGAMRGRVAECFGLRFSVVA